MNRIFPFLFFFFAIHFTLAQNKIIDTGDEWEYYDKGEDPTHDWTRETRLLDGWKTGISPLGYGDSVVTTEIDYGGDPKNKHLVKYFKKVFTLDDPFEFLVYEIGVKMDDGAVIYLNGREINRHNMPVGKITNSTRASSLVVMGKNEAIFHKTLLSPEDFNAGINVISASVHQGRKTSSDCIFSLELKGNNDTDVLPSLLKERTLKNLSLNLKIKELENKSIIEKKNLETELLIQNKDNYKYALYALIVVFLLFIISAFVFFLNRKKLFSTLKEDLMFFKNQNTRKSQELMNYSLSSIQQQQFLKETKHSLEESINENDTELKKSIKKLIRQIDYSIEQDDDWLKLLNHFNSIHKGYLDRLVKKHTSLSETELRHCIFIKLYMQTKEIAKILHIDPKSVQAARYRIKKKMNLSENIDLRNYLQEF